MEKNLALGTLKSFVKNTDDVIIKDAILTLHPELAESEDERMRKHIIDIVRENAEAKSIPWEAEFTWLEKQKEQKGEDEECTDFTIYHPLKNGEGKYECIPYSFYGSLTSFSEDKDLIDFLRTCFYTEEECNEWIKQQKEKNKDIALRVKGEGVYKICPHCKERMIRDDSKVYTSMPPQYGYNCPKCGALEFDTVKYDSPDNEKEHALKDTLRDYFVRDEIANAKIQGRLDGINEVKNNPESYGLCKPAEWSEEDRRILKCIIGLIDHDQHYGVSNKEMIDWLKSLRPQPHWKPSEKQMEVLKNILSVGCGVCEWYFILESLYNDLKSL